MIMKRGIKPKVIIYQKALLRIITSSLAERTFMIKRFEEIRKLTTGHGEDYTIACLLDYDYIKNNFD